MAPSRERRLQNCSATSTSTGVTLMIANVTDVPKSQNSALPLHIAETVDAIAWIHADHQLKRTGVERFIDNWTAGLARPAVLAAVLCGVALWIAINSLAPVVGYTIIDQPPFPWLSEALTFLGLIMGILILSTQRRADQLAELREQMTLELASVTERKVAKVIELIEELRRDSPYLENRTDQEATQMSVRTSPAEVLVAIKDSHEDIVARGTDTSDIPAMTSEPKVE